MAGEPVLHRIAVDCTGCGRKTWMEERAAEDRVRRRRARCDICGAPLSFPSSLSYAGMPLGQGVGPDTIVFEAAPPAVVQEKIAALRAEELASGEKLLSTGAAAGRLSWGGRIAVGSVAGVLASAISWVVEVGFDVGAAAMLLVGVVIYIVVYHQVKKRWLR